MAFTLFILSLKSLTVDFSLQMTSVIQLYVMGQGVKMVQTMGEANPKGENRQIKPQGGDRVSYKCI